MNIILIIVAIFAVLGGIDRIFGNKFGLSDEFEKGFAMLGTLCLAMVGMIVISPLLADLFKPLFSFFYETFKIDPSILTSSIFANDMGGASLAKEVAKNEQIGLFNGLIVSSMMGVTISFTIPLAVSSLKKEKHDQLMLGLLCGIVTIPIGCFIGGLVSKINILVFFLNLLPLIIFAIIIVLGLYFVPHICIKIFNVLGVFMKCLITVGLLLGILKYLLGFEPIKGLASIEEGAEICFNISVFLAGAFPFLLILSNLLKKPMAFISKKLKINEKSTMGFIFTLANSVLTFGMMDEMDEKGTVLNSAFAVSAAFVFADHLAFTMAFDSSYVFQMMIAKLSAGFLALGFALIVYKRIGTKLFSKDV